MDNVSANAFSIVEQALQEKIDFLCEEMTQASLTQNLEKIRNLAFIIDRINALKQRLHALHKEFLEVTTLVKELASECEPEDTQAIPLPSAEALKELQDSLGISKKQKKLSTKHARISRGIATSQTKYRVPLLQALVLLGGSASIRNVLGKVYEMMKATLLETDHLELPSGEIRWENNVHWARSFLLKQGLMEPSKQRGIWQISAKGREYLEQYQEQHKEPTNQVHSNG